MAVPIATALTTITLVVQAHHIPTAMSGGSIQPPSRLDFSDAQRGWPEYKRRFERYRSASGLSDKSAQRQVDMLIYCMGEEAEEIANQITVRAPTADEDADGTLFKRTVEAFDSYFNPRDNHLHYAVLLGSRVQQADETNEQFIRVLHEMVSKCTGWDEDHRKDMLKTRLLAGMRDKEMSRELQLKADVTLDYIKQQMRMKEVISRNQKAELDGERQVLAVRSATRPKDRDRTQRGLSTAPAADTTHQQRSRADSQIADCKFCGGTHARGRCPAYNKQCNKCRRLGHFGKVCQSKPTQQYRQSYNREQVNQLSVCSGSDSDDDTFSVHPVSKPSSRPTVSHNKWLLNLTVEGQTIEARVDTGAEVSTMSKSVFLQLGGKEVTKTKATLVGYGNQNIPVIGRAKLSVCVPTGLTGDVTFYITDNDNQTLLGMPAIGALGLIPQLGVNQVSNNKSSQSLIQNYPEVFVGLGKFGDPVKLVLKDTATPKQVSTRLVPQNMRGKLKKELARLERDEVIVRECGSSEWNSPLVLVSKPNGDIRICLDPQYLNSQLVRSKCAIPTTTEIFSKISGSQFFTTLDARQGFHQLMLDEQSSKLTSFVTPYGKYRYTRLPMGISCAPEIFHQRISDAMCDLEGVEVYLDDFLVHARTLEEHDIRLELVLQRCKELGLTLNPDKVVLAQKTVSYLGHELSGEGVRPGRSKVEAVHNMTVPTDKKAVQRFLGFVNYLAKFIPNLSQHTQPLRQLCKNNTQFLWGVQQSEAFQTIKRLIAQAPTLMLFQPGIEVTLSADSSSHSLGAVALQNDRLFEFAAKSLTDCQMRYSQIEK